MMKRLLFILLLISILAFTTIGCTSEEHPEEPADIIDETTVTSSDFKYRVQTNHDSWHVNYYTNSISLSASTVHITEPYTRSGFGKMIPVGHPIRIAGDYIIHIYR